MIRDHKLTLAIGYRYHWCSRCWRLVRRRTIFSTFELFGETWVIERASFWYHVGDPTEAGRQDVALRAV